MSTGARKPFITPEEYLARERLAEFKSEYYEGEIRPLHLPEQTMSTVAKKTFITPEEYLAAERLAEFKSEYYDGQVYAMAGTSFRHALIAGNLHAMLHSQLRDGSCRPLASDLRLRTKGSSTYMYPDLMVICGPPEFAEGVFDTVLNPTVIIEVLSPSTELWDRSGKF